MGGTTMRIKLEKKAEGYKPVKGNELEIIKHLCGQNFYEDYSIDGNRIEVEGRICRIISFEIEENWGRTSFSNEKDVFFKCEKNGQIKIRYSEPKPKKCIGVIFDEFNVDTIEILQAKNFKGLRRDSYFSKGDGWELKTTTDTFKVDRGDLVIIDDDKKIIDCLRHGINTAAICLSDEYRIKMRD
ncbi:hypothetical protein [Methanobrevibacter intestini]|uniref:hypothetical protein n=1 Tax=Methanobrevibacter intestini TaxID=2911853 RepID=UPI003D01A377